MAGASGSSDSGDEDDASPSQPPSPANTLATTTGFGDSINADQDDFDEFRAKSRRGVVFSVRVKACHLCKCKSSDLAPYTN
jgi:hypothetical protein